MSAKTEFDLRVISYPEDGLWLAHCLELDIVVEGETAKQALADLIDLCLLHIRTAIDENDLVSIIRPAPGEYWKMFFSARKRKRIRPSPNGVLAEIEGRKVELV
ncbi:MAG: hypothetical protein HYX68_17250 [Planctomycetes bacterium]|nr:hypothetical protein [Planctomycetota bacterium]